MVLIFTSALLADWIGNSMVESCDMDRNETCHQRNPSILTSEVKVLLKQIDKSPTNREGGDEDWRMKLNKDDCADAKTTAMTELSSTGQRCKTSLP